MYKIIGGDGKEYGPVPAEVVREWVAQGRANAQTKILPEGATEWKLLAEIAELAQALPGAGASTPPPPLNPVALATQPRNNPMAVAGLVLGIFSVTCGICCYGVPFNIAGIILSIIGLVQISGDPRTQKGKGMAVAGLVLSVLSVLLAIAAGLFIALNPTDWLRRIQNL